MSLKKKGRPRRFESAFSCFGKAPFNFHVSKFLGTSRVFTNERLVWSQHIWYQRAWCYRRRLVKRRCRGPSLFEDRCYSNIHSFESLYDKILPTRDKRYAYQILIFARTQTVTNQFNKNLFSIRIGLEFQIITLNNKSFYYKIGKLVTIFLQNLPFKSDDIKTLLNKAPGTKH